MIAIACIYSFWDNLTLLLVYQSVCLSILLSIHSSIHPFTEFRCHRLLHCAHFVLPALTARQLMPLLFFVL